MSDKFLVRIHEIDTGWIEVQGRHASDAIDNAIEMLAPQHLKGSSATWTFDAACIEVTNAKRDLSMKYTSVTPRA